MNRINWFWKKLWSDRYLFFTLALASWFFTNGLFLLASKTTVFTLAFVAEISLPHYLTMWAVLFICFCGLWYRPRKLAATYIPAIFSIFFYVTAILVKEMVLV